MPTQKIDPKVIFASDAPIIDRPPIFSDKTKGWDVARANDGRPTIKEMNKVQQDTDLKILWLNENSVTPYDESIDYPDGAVSLKDGSFKQLVSGAWVEFLDDFANKDQVKRGIANRYDSSLTYNSGERVVLITGDIVKSTIDGNTNDPNVDMTGWVFDSESAQLKLKKPFPFTILRSLRDELSTKIHPEDFGCVGDAVFDAATQSLISGTDNTSSFQKMLNEAHYHGVPVYLPNSAKYATGSLYLHNDPIKNPDWSGRIGRIQIVGGVTGHATGNVEPQGAGIFHIEGNTDPLISMVGRFDIASPTGMGGYFHLKNVNLIGSKDSSDVLLMQGSQGGITLEDYTVKVLNPDGNGITERTTWETTHRNGLIRGGAAHDAARYWTGLGLNICSDGTTGQINMKVYQNVNCYKMGYGIRIGRRGEPNGTFGPLVFLGGQTSLSDQHGMWLDGGVISLTTIGQQHEGARRNAIRFDRNIEGGVVSSDIPRTVKMLNTYITGCGLVEDGSTDSFAVYAANGDGIELDGFTFNNVGDGIGFDAGNVDNLLIRRPTVRTARNYGVTSGTFIKAFGTQEPTKRQYLEHPVFNQSTNTLIEATAKQIFSRGDVGGRLSFNNNVATPNLRIGSTESAKVINLNYSTQVDITNFINAQEFQELLITFANTNPTIKDNRSTIFLNGGDFKPTGTRDTLRLYYDGTRWVEVARSTSSIRTELKQTVVINSIAAGVSALYTLTLAGVKLGDNLNVSMDIYNADIELFASASAVDEITVKVKNTGASSITLGSTMLTVKKI